jgi:hypothetical protein
MAIEVERKNVTIFETNEVHSSEEEPLKNKPEELPTLSIEERKKLHGWTASYELAKIAKLAII